MSRHRFSSPAFALALGLFAPTASITTFGTAEAFAADPVGNVSYDLVIHGDVDGPELRDALARELKASVVLAADGPSDARRRVTVSHDRTTRELAVTYSEAGRSSVSRVVAAPSTKGEVVQLATLLAGNLARHQVDDLLGPEPAPPPPLPAPEAPAAPAPDAPAPAPAPAPSEPPEDMPANVALFYPIATNANRRDARVHLDVNVLYSEVATLDGMSLGMFSNARLGARGLRTSFLLNHTGGALHGADLALAANLARGPVEGLQVAFAGNSAGGGLEGMQAALVVNHSGGSTKGLQVAFGGNLSGGAVEGAQAAFGLNVARGDVEGAQAAFGLNVARGDVSGLQLGLVNVGKAVKGVQLGLVNVADDVEGLPIGLISVTKSGGIHPVIWASNTSYGNAGIKFATRHTFTMVSGHVHAEDGRAQGGPGFTVGGRIPIDRLVVEIDVQGAHLFGDALCCGDARTLRSQDKTLAKLRASLGFHFADHLTVFLGGGATGTVRYPATGGYDVTIGPELFGGLEL